MTQKNYTIGSFANSAKVNVETIRYYQRKGLLNEPDKPYGGIRRYGEQDLSALRFIKTAQWLGFSLDEIRGLIQLDVRSHCHEISQLAQNKLTAVRNKINNLKQMEAIFSDLIRDCNNTHQDVTCPLIESLQEQSQIMHYSD